MATLLAIPLILRSVNRVQWNPSKAVPCKDFGQRMLKLGNQL
jgi:hypothetical protein